MRIQWIDAMRGFSMILVVFGHVNTWMDIPYYESFLSVLLVTFRMPLFFFVSGFFSYRLLSWWNKRRISDIIKRKIQAQLICTFIFYSIYQITLGQGYIDYSKGFYVYWFTIVLFQMYITYLFFSLISRLIQRDITNTCLIASSIISLVIVAFYKSDSSIWNILCWENFTKYYQYYAIGIICSRYRDKFFTLLENHIFKTIMIIGWIVCLLLWYNEEFEKNFTLFYRLIHDVLIRYFSLMTVVIIFYHSAKKIDFSRKGKKLQLIGKRTLDIYMLHFFLLPTGLIWLKPYLLDGNMFVIQFIIAASITFVIVGMCLVISEILRLSPFLTSWLFGVKN